MAVNVVALLATITPLLKLFSFAVLFLVIVGGGGYYFFIVKRRRKWHCRIWEHKGDGKIHLVFNDTLIRYRYDKNKKTLFMFKISKGLAQPPPDESVDRYRGKEYCDYLRINNDEFIPIQKEIADKRIIDILKSKEKKTVIIKKIISKLLDIETLTLPEIKSKYVYAAMGKNTITTSYTPIDYDVDMMRMQGIESRDEFYKLKNSFWEKWGTMITIGSIIVLIIVISYLSFEYMTNIINQGFAQSEAIQNSGNQVANSLDRLVNSVGGAPPS